MRGLGQDDRGLCVVGQIVQCRHKRPAVHLRLVNLLGTVVQPCRIAQADCVRRRKQAEVGVGCDNLVLVHQRQFAVGFKNALDDEHHIGAACVVFVKDNRDRVAQRPWQNAFVEFGDLHAIAQLDRVFPDQIDPADVAQAS